MKSVGGEIIRGQWPGNARIVALLLDEGAAMLLAEALRRDQV